ncbi:MAG TPA: hypothetical protein DEH78_21580 [Solibacterales bacterium]|nr:hypothetical protein [Bryobacterales bacterium]
MRHAAAGMLGYEAVWDRFVLKVKRGDGPVYSALRGVARTVLRAALPPLPTPLKMLARVVYAVHYTLVALAKWLLAALYYQPLFQSRCRRVGRGLRVEGMPFVLGHTTIDVGNDVSLLGKVDIVSGRFHDRPTLTIGNRVSIGHLALITVNQEVVIEDDVIVSFNCRIADSDGHPRDAALRAAHAPLSPRDIRPVRIGRHAWIGNGSAIMKGVTIGEGAIIGANSVVIGDVPPYCIAMGNPAEVYFRNVGRPRNATGA